MLINKIIAYYLRYYKTVLIQRINSIDALYRLISGGLEYTVTK